VCSYVCDSGDTRRFTVELLLDWKSASECEASKRLGKTAALKPSPSLALKLNDRIRIAPIIPRRVEQAEWLISGDSQGTFLCQKLGSGAQVEVPLSFIEKVHSFVGAAPALVQLAVDCMEFCQPELAIDAG